VFCSIRLCSRKLRIGTSHVRGPRLRQRLTSSLTGIAEGSADREAEVGDEVVGERPAVAVRSAARFPRLSGSAVTWFAQRKVAPCGAHPLLVSRLTIAAGAHTRAGLCFAKPRSEDSASADARGSAGRDAVLTRAAEGKPPSSIDGRLPRTPTVR
jgi:hypothetical protein